MNKTALERNLWPVIHWVIRPFGEILFSDEINKKTESGQRATVLSISSFAANLLIMISLPILGYMIDIWSLGTMYLFMAALLVVTGLISAVGIYYKKSSSF